MAKKNKTIKGIPLSKINLEDSIITNEDNVLKFFEDHSREAFSIQMLRDAGFSSNIRKIIQRLTDKEKIFQTSHQEEGKSKWEYVYYLRPPKSVFDLKKTNEGWELEKVTINSKWFLVECHHDKNPNSYDFNKGIVIITLGFPSEGDCVLYSKDTDDYSGIESINSIRHSEIHHNFEHLKRRVYICQEYDDLWDFDIHSPGKRSRVSKSSSIIEGEELILWAGNVGLLFVINSKDQTITVYPRYRELDYDGTVIEEEFIDYYDLNYGYDEMTEDFSSETFDLVAIGNLHENYEADIIKKEVSYVILRGRI